MFWTLRSKTTDFNAGLELSNTAEYCMQNIPYFSWVFFATAFASQLRRSLSLVFFIRSSYIWFVSYAHHLKTYLHGYLTLEKVVCLSIIWQFLWTVIIAQKETGVEHETGIGRAWWIDCPQCKLEMLIHKLVFVVSRRRCDGLKC